MAELCLPDQLTPCKPPDLYASLGRAWKVLILDSACTRASLLVLLAHWALETGFGHFAHRWNLGNLKHVHGDGCDFTMVKLNEVMGGKVVWYTPPDPATWLRAYPDLDAGARDYLVRLRAEFRAAWPAVIAGDVAQFCHLLKLARYYTADEALYTAGVERCFRQLDTGIPADADPIAGDDGITTDPHDATTRPSIPANPPSIPPKA